MINLIWAMERNNLIGKDNKLPWQIPAELKYFSQITAGQTILMGAKTFASIGKPLKNRHNIVITRNLEKYQNWQAKNLIFTSNLQEVLAPYQKDPTKHIFVIGGREIYQQTYAVADYYYVSLIKGNYEGNVYFPFDDWNKGELIKKREFLDFTACIYKRC
ncbi:Dihydrofolate reductase [endosymbiont DhMRE of Dentiscutata heterogama]|uniref:dihydrofolate reductase n=1 Tax=endosymbiont DhMRE of Dentiscutata heterogama TaxID=1609546 RepID=UPI000629D840|nr:dihydrofolate reductase [endosymbiont DhMRE of Dentiscutata heterogama]CFW93053.1 Dihydrofolate reductase [endosymbiont DhMRE of Dentiscutata heterogama]